MIFSEIPCVVKKITGFLAVTLIVVACSAEAQNKPVAAQKANSQSLSKWVADFKAEAHSEGISKPLLNKAFASFKPNAKIIRLDRKQPEGTKTFTQYMTSVVPKFRVNQGKKHYASNKKLLDEISTKYGVQARFIVALWGIETSYGKITGGFNVPHALATLAYDGRRSAFFRKELKNSLKIIDGGIYHSLT